MRREDAKSAKADAKKRRKKGRREEEGKRG
jgi:hypothetical protein